MKSISLSLMAFVALLFAHINTAQAASDATEGGYVSGALASQSGAIDSSGSFIGNDSYSFGGVGFKLGGGYFFTKNIRLDGSYRTASVTSADLIDGERRDGDISALSVAGDYVFDNGLYLGAGVASVTVVVDDYSVGRIAGSFDELSTVAPEFRLGGYWQYDHISVDLNFTMSFASSSGDIKANGVRVGELDLISASALSIGVGYHF